MKKILLFVVSALSLTAVTAQKIAVAKGQKLETVIATKMNMSMEMMGQTMDNTMESTNTVEAEVKDNSASAITLTNTLKKVLVSASMMGQDISFDSDKKEDMDGQMGQALKGKVGVPTEIKLDAGGKITEAPAVQGEKNPINDVAGVGFNMVKGQQFPLLIPGNGKALKVGDTWTDSTVTAEAKNVSNYTVKEIKDGAIVLSITGTFTQNGKMEQQGMEMQMNMSGNIKGEASYEATTGWLRNDAKNIDIKATIDVMGQSVPLTMTVVTTSTAKKI